MKVSPTVSASDPSGEMDDVLDNICSIFHRGSIHRYVPLLVSAALFSTLLLLFLHQELMLSYWGRNFPLIFPLQASFLL